LLIVALADRGVLISRIRGESAWILELAAHARAADVSGVPDKAGGGAPPKLPVNSVAALVVTYFERITGGDADRLSEKEKGSAGLNPLVREIFLILGVSANAKAAVKVAHVCPRR
jgi:hypothetical protein